MSLTRIFFLLLLLTASFKGLSQEKVFPGADEKSPSRAQYFSWINNTNEGATEKQTLINLDFFKWLHDEYGMVLDIYAFDAGAIDGAGYYGDANSEKFKNQFPRGFKPIYEKASMMGTRLGIWGGPDGFGNTPEEEKARTNLMVGLAKDYKFELFKFDGVCGNLRNEKQDAFINMMQQVRTHSPNLILLNHRLNLGKGLPHATTWLWEGAETYIDVHMVNQTTAPHHRAAAMSRGLPPDLSRLTEDHGVCISSCLDFWDDELILQAFNRSLILAPEIYGSPWLLKDSEFPKLARIYNLHRKYRDILVNGMVLPEKQYGPHAVSRGDKNTRLITLRNMSWNPVKYKVKLDQSIGLEGGNQVYVYQYHPSEKVVGKFTSGAEVEVEVLPFRSFLLMASHTPSSEVQLKGSEYAVVRDVPGKPVIIKVQGYPGSGATVSLEKAGRKFTKATLDGKPVNALVNGKSVTVKFPGKALSGKWHRKLGELAPSDVPADAEALYEATCFAADNNALEVRSLYRSGETKVQQVKLARDAFFEQPLFIERGIWDKYAFDGDDKTGFYVCRRWEEHQVKVNGGGLRIDLGSPVKMDKLVIDVGNEYYLQPLKSTENVRAEVSSDLKTWTVIPLRAGIKMVSEFKLTEPIRYIRLHSTPDRVSEIRGYFEGKELNRSEWKASNLFSPYEKAQAVKAWTYSFTGKDIMNGSYLAVAVNGKHGREGVYAAIRVDGKLVGAPDRSVSFPSNTWEVPVRAMDGNYTYYFPLSKDMEGKKIEVVLLGLNKEAIPGTIEVWQTAYPIPFEEKELVLAE